MVEHSVGVSILARPRRPGATRGGAVNYLGPQWLFQSSPDLSAGHARIGYGDRLEYDLAELFQSSPDLSAGRHSQSPSRPRTSAAMFQSSPDLSAGRYPDRPFRVVYGTNVSILARPLGRAPFCGHVPRLLDRLFQSSPDLSAGRHSILSSVTMVRLKFQSSPDLSAGRPLADVPGSRPVDHGFNPRPTSRPGAATSAWHHQGHLERVSILARPLGRALRCADSTRSWSCSMFQSSPGLSAGRYPAFALTDAHATLRVSILARPLGRALLHDRYGNTIS